MMNSLFLRPFLEFYIQCVNKSRPFVPPLASIVFEDNDPLLAPIIFVTEWLVFVGIVTPG
jgi:hypothetical protein